MISYKVLKDTITEYWKESKETNAIVSGGSYDQNTGLFTVPVGYRGHIQPPETAPLSSAGSWEIKTKVTYRGGGRYPCIFGYGGGSDYKAPCLLNQGGTYKIAVSFTGGGWDIWGETGIAPQQNTTYYFKVGFTGDTYYVDYRTEGQKAYTRAFSYSSTETAVCITPFWFMDLSLNNNYPTYGDLDLTETSISINGEIWWQGTKGRTPATPEDYDIITTKTAYKPLTETDAKYWKYEGKTINGAGSGAGWTIDEDNDTFMNIGTASFQTPETLPLATANSWEIGLVARMTSSGTDPCFVGYTGTSDFKAPCLTFSYNTLRVFLSTTGTSWNLASSGDTGIVKEMNRTYYVKYGFTGGTYYVDLHLDGEDTYRRVWSMNSTAKVHCSVPHQFMGLNLNPSYYAVKGVLYLDDVYCKINGDMYWQAVKRDVVPATPDDYDFTTETHVYKALRVWEPDPPRESYYWKLVDWTQPAATSADHQGIINGSYPFYGGDAWKALDGNIILSSDTTGFVSASAVKFWQWTMKESIHASKVTLWKDSPHFATQTLTVTLLDASGESLYVSPVLTWERVNSIEIELPIDVEFQAIRIDWLSTDDGNGRVFLQECVITGYKAIPGTPDDYDFITYTPPKPESPYWVQPRLIDDGTMGVDAFAVTSSGTWDRDPVDHKAFRAFDNDTDTQWQKNNVSTSGFTEYLTFYIQDGVKLQSLEITNTDQQYTTSSGGLYVMGSNDGTNWVVNSPNLPVEGQTTPSATWIHEVNWDVPYKYFKIFIHPLYGGAIMIREVKIHALK